MSNSGSSLVRTRYFVIFLFITIGFSAALIYWPSDYSLEKMEDWRSFSSTLAGVSATMVGFLCAVGALLYTVANTPLVAYLRENGIERRILIDLFSATLTWLATLFFCIFASFPKANISPISSGMIGFGFSISGLLSFLPIGYSLWTILSNLNIPSKELISKDKINPKEFQTPTDLD